MNRNRALQRFDLEIDVIVVAACPGDDEIAGLAALARREVAHLVDLGAGGVLRVRIRRDLMIA